MSDHLSEMNCKGTAAELTYELMLGLNDFDPKLDTHIETARVLFNLTAVKTKNHPSSEPILGS